jgi:hypothetical protein
MKKSSIIFSLVLAASLLAPSPVLAVANVKTPVIVETKENVATGPMEQKEESGMVEKVDYTLPYPGILPDHPLYFLKKLRDQILEQLISDPIRKIEFYVLQSDKALNAGIFLGARSKQALASEMFVKSGAFMENAIKTATSMKTQGREIPGYVVERLNKSLVKHGETLNDLGQKAAETQKANLSSALEVIKKLQLEVASFK